ncbi:MAG: cyclase family protein [Halolamina sp.]
MHLDLTHPVTTGMQRYPGDPAVELSAHATHEADGYRVTAVAAGSHTGTHVDAPSHTEPGGDDLDAVDVAAFDMTARVVDCTDVGSREPISPETVPTDGDLDAVVFHTGWDRHWGTDRYRDHPFLTPETARRCAAADYDVGVDALSVDPTPSARGDAGDGDVEGDGSDGRETDPDGVPAHHAILGAGNLVVENLTGLAAAPERIRLQAYPLALGVDGAPVRAVATEPRSESK